MAETPRGSPPMYFPAAPFVFADAVTCAALVDIAYDQYIQWQNQDYPSKFVFAWNKPNNGYTYSAPLYWTYSWFGETYDEPFGFAGVDQSGNAYLVFRGTMSHADELQDVRTDQTAYQIVPGYGYVHAGFYEIYQLLSGQVNLALSGLAQTNPFKRLFITGHSLGCGLSSLAIPDVLAHCGINPKNTPVLHYNFASPRVGDPQFAWSMNANGIPTYRIVNTEDLVPDTPPAVLGWLLFKHIGTPVDFTAQYDTTLDNHGLDIAYTYALAHPDNPEGPVPKRTLGLASRTGIPVAIEGKVRRVSRSAVATPV